MVDYTKKKKKDYPERQFTATSSLNDYFSRLEDDENDKKAMNIVHNLYMLQNPNYSGSSEAAYNQKLISGGSSSSNATGMSTRYNMMQDADKERVSKEFTTIFQGEDFPDMETFYKWTKTMGPWYSETLLRQHEAITKNRVDAMKSTKVGEAVDTLFGEYNDEWATGSYAEQNQVRQNIADSDAIKNLPSKWRAAAVDEVIKMLNTFLSPTGQYAAAGEARKVAGEARSVAGEDANVLARRRLRDKDHDKTIESNFLKEAIDDIDGTVAGIPYADQEKLDIETVRKDLSAKLIRAGIDTTNAMQTLDEMYGTRAQKIAREKPPGTKPVYDPATDSTIFATDAEIEADDSLIPTAAESNLDPDTARIGALMAVKGEMPNDVWKKYYKGGMDLLYNSLVGPDAEHIKKWLLLVEEYKAKKAASVNINYGMLNPDSTGQATGRTDDGISNVRKK